MKLLLGAYQQIEAKQDLEDQFGGVFGPHAIAIKLTTPMDVEFQNRTVTAILNTEDQLKIIRLFTRNLQGFILDDEPDEVFEQR